VQWGYYCFPSTYEINPTTDCGWIGRWDQVMVIKEWKEEKLASSAFDSEFTNRNTFMTYNLLHLLKDA
jgi:hypothetical protein